MQETLKRMTQVKKLSNNKYLITINNKEYKLHTDTILKYNLLSSDVKYSHDEIIHLDNLMKLSLSIDKYFIRYPKSIKEAIYLIINKYKINDYKPVIDRLIKLNILNDDRLKLNIIESLENRLYGPNYINNVLYKRGLVNDYNVTYSISDLIYRFNKLLKNKDNNKDKILRYLLSKGYSFSDINLYFNHNN